MTDNDIVLTPSLIAGMGAISTPEGTSFRVWAPFAQEVYVVGDFNHWNPTQNRLCMEKNGYWSVMVPEAHVEHEYKYRIVNGEMDFLKNDPYARKINNHSKNTVIYDSSFDWSNDNFIIPSHNLLVIYELHVGTFSSAKGKNTGTFEGVRKKLGYLKELGINAIELMPPIEFPTDLSWGYNLTNPFAVEESYGGANELKKLILEAHTHGIAVIIDVVFNHFGPQDLDLWQFDGWSENNMGGIYFYNDWRAWTPWGDNRPDYGRGEVRQYIRDSALLWIEEFHADGLRFDAVSFIRSVRGYDNDPTNELSDGWSLLQWINNEIHSLYPQKITIAEDLQCNPWITKATEEGGAGFNAQWDAQFIHPVRQTVVLPEDSHRDMSLVEKALITHYNGNPFSRIIYSESHDEVANGKARIPHEISPSEPDSYYAKKRSILAAALTMTAPGIPMVFSGQEILEDDWFRDDRPIDWGKLGSFRGINRLYHDLIQLRKNVDGFSAGLTGPNIHVNHINYEDKVLGFHRWDVGGAGDDVIVIASFSNQSFKDYVCGFPSGGLWKVRFNSDWDGYDETFQNFSSFNTEAIPTPNHQMPYQALIDLGPYSFLILSQDRPNT